MRRGILFACLTVGLSGYFLLTCTTSSPLTYQQVPHAYACDTLLFQLSIADTGKLSKIDTVSPGDTLTFAGFYFPIDTRPWGRYWNFGDGVTDTQPIVRHSYSTTGEFHARFLVYDMVGDTLCDSVIVRVNTPPDSVRLISPSEGASLESKKPLLSWKGFDRDTFDTALSYLVVIGKKSGFIDTILNWGETTDVAIDSGVERGDSVFWLVTARDRFGGTVTSDTGKFSIQKSADATLSALIITVGTKTFAPAMSDSVFFDTVPNTASAMKISFSSSEAAARIAINDKQINPGDSAVTLGLPYLNNTFIIAVTAPDGMTRKTYTANVIRLPGTNALLSSMTPSAGKLNPSFSETILSYFDTIPDGTNSVSFIPKAQDSTASIKVNGVPCKSGSLSSAIALSSGPNNPIPVTVTAQDGKAVTHYQVQIIFKAQPVAPPADVSALPQGPSSIRVTWQDGPSIESGYKLLRSLSGDSGFIEVKILDSNATSALDTGLLPGTAYYYSVCSFTPRAVSKFSNIAVAMTKVSLNVTVYNGTGGSVSLMPNQQVFNKGDSVKISASPSEGYHFTGWTGDTTGKINPLIMVLARNMTISACFVNRPPQFQNLKDTIAVEGKPLSFTVSAFDPDSDAVTLLSGTLPSGATFNSATGAFQWTPTHDQGGLYSISFVAGDGKLYTSAGITIVVYSLPKIDKHPSNVTVCAGQGAVLSVIASGSGPLKYQWVKSGTALSGAAACSVVVAEATPSDSGVYGCVVSNDVGTAAGAPCTLTVNEPPKFNDSLKNQLKCSGDVVVFKAKATGTPPMRYQWRKNGDSIPGAIADTFLIAGASTADTGHYLCFAENVCGNKSTNPAVLALNVKSTAPTGASATQSLLCQGSPTTLSVVGGSLGTNAVWNWYAGSCGGTSIGTGASITQSPSVTTTFHVRAEGPCNSTACASITVTVQSQSSAPTGIAADKSTICAGDSATLTVNGGILGAAASWEWYSGSCSGGTFIGVGTSILVKPTTTTSYSVRGRGDCNTTGWVCKTITVGGPSQAPTAASASNTTICQGSSTTLSVSGGTLGTGAVWQWYSGACGAAKVDTGASVTISPGATTTYFVRAEGGCGGPTECKSVTVTVDTFSRAPTIVSPASIALCPGAFTSLTVMDGSLGTKAKWKWYRNAVCSDLADSGETIAVAPSVNTTYYVRAEGGSCGIPTATASATVTLKTPTNSPTGITGAPTTSICPGTPITLTVSGTLGTDGAYWVWRTGSCTGTIKATSTSSLTDTPSTTTTYFVQANGGCLGPTACAPGVTVTVKARTNAPSGITGAPSAAVCPGTGVTLTVSGSLGTDGAYWVWRTGSCTGPVKTTTTASSISDNPTATTVYFVQATGGCLGTTACAPEATVTVKTPTNAPTGISGAPSAAVCSGTGVTLTVNGTLGNDGAYWVWRTGGCTGTILTTTTASSITDYPSASTTYFVQANGGCLGLTSCAPSATVNVTSITSAPTGISGAPTNTICPGLTVSLSVNGALGTDGARWVWRTGSCTGPVLTTTSLQTIVVVPNTSTAYYVQADGGCLGATACTHATVTVGLPPYCSSYVSSPNRLLPSDKVLSKSYQIGEF